MVHTRVIRNAIPRMTRIADRHAGPIHCIRLSLISFYTPVITRKGKARRTRCEKNKKREKAMKQQVGQGPSALFSLFVFFLFLG